MEVSCIVAILVLLFLLSNGKNSSNVCRGLYVVLLWEKNVAINLAGIVQIARKARAKLTREVFQTRSLRAG